MKKALLWLLALVMLALPTLALADDELNFNEENVANIPGEFVALEDFGLMFYLPEELVAQEVSDELAAQGIYAFYMNEAQTRSMSIGYAPAVNAEGQAVASLEELCSVFVGLGLTDASIGTLNGLPCIAWSTQENGQMGITMYTEKGYQLTFTFAPTTDAEYLCVSSAVISSIMELQYEE